MDKCSRCEIEGNLYLLYPKGEYPNKANRIVVCGKCLPEKVVKVSSFSYESKD